MELVKHGIVFDVVARGVIQRIKLEDPVRGSKQRIRLEDLAEDPAEDLAEGTE